MTAPMPEGFERVRLALAAAGHPNGVFVLSPAELQKPTGAPVLDVVRR